MSFAHTFSYSGCFSTESWSPLDRISTNMSQPRHCLGGGQDSERTRKQTYTYWRASPASKMPGEQPEMHREEVGRCKRAPAYLWDLLETGNRALQQSCYSDCWRGRAHPSTRTTWTQQPELQTNWHLGVFEPVSEVFQQCLQPCPSMPGWACPATAPQN